MGDVIYRSNVRIEKQNGPLRFAYLPGRDEHVRFGVHGAVAEHYGVQPDAEDATTLDYVIAAAAG